MAQSIAIDTTPTIDADAAAKVASKLEWAAWKAEQKRMEEPSLAPINPALPNEHQVLDASSPIGPGVRFRGSPQRPTTIDLDGPRVSTIPAVFAQNKEYVKFTGSGRLLKSSFGAVDQPDPPKIMPTCYGLLGTLVEAYNKHAELVLRPDDLWLAVVAQFNLYVNGNAEALRTLFVQHQGKKELFVQLDEGNVHTFDYVLMVEQFVRMIGENLNSAETCQWLVAPFTTTTPNDTIALAIAVMATFQKYFSFSGGLDCGVPYFTLLGTLEDWELLRTKIEGLLKCEMPQAATVVATATDKTKPPPYGKTPMQSWVDMLMPIVDNFILAYQGHVNYEFWGRMCSQRTEFGSGSSATYYEGWMTAFNVFNENGRWIATAPMEDPNGHRRRGHHGANPNYIHDRDCIRQLRMSGRAYDELEDDKLAGGMTMVPIKAIDREGDHPVMAFGGHIGSDIVAALSDQTPAAALRPRADWAFALVDQAKIDAAVAAERAQEEFYERKYREREAARKAKEEAYRASPEGIARAEAERLAAEAKKERLAAYLLTPEGIAAKKRRDEHLAKEEAARQERKAQRKAFKASPEGIAQREKMEREEQEYRARVAADKAARAELEAARAARFS